MPPLRRAATASGGGDLSSLALQDALAQKNGLYLVDDFIGDLPFSGAYAGTGGYGCSYGTPGGVPTFYGGWTAADVAGHPGLLNCNTAALNDLGAACASFNSQFLVVSPNTGKVTWNCLAGQWNSTADSLLYQIGPAYPVNTGMYHGFWLEYQTGVNSGNWVLKEGQAGGVTTIANGTAPPPGSKVWYNVQFVINGTSVTASVNGTAVAQGTSTILSANANNGMIITKGAHLMKRVSFSSGTVMAFLDRVSLSMNGINR